LCLFFRASGAAAAYEARNLGAPYTPKQLSKAFERALYEIFTDPQGPFKQKPGIYPEESAARSAATIFISETLYDAAVSVAQPIAGPENICKELLTRAIKDKNEVWKAANEAESEEDKAVRHLLHSEETHQQQPETEFDLFGETAPESQAAAQV